MMMMIDDDDDDEVSKLLRGILRASQPLPPLSSPLPAIFSCMVMARFDHD